MKPLQTFGFTAEILSFVYTGVLLDQGKYLLAGVFLILSVAIALLVGKLISKDAIEKYKEVKE